ncbi:response regulator transcription factor [Aureicoccus marinus]|uniref:HTH luxR-type domain-containing protein n=1 Tax=Aureicoccus marinus TaxID=754435 RepID=A0A2S7TB45_9FLAO|nr:helix-turn-helix transcriptional regulator [Aureicoccus marinus]PQJ16696.1 hypothetical protein BST99_14070 [Aureicoccus marinus]
MTKKGIGFLVFSMLFSCMASGQFSFEGQVPKEWAGQLISLSLIKDPLRSDRVYADQILLQSEVDSLGQFAFKGAFLPEENRLYRIHAAPCFEGQHDSRMRCHGLEERFFVANNQDQLVFRSIDEGGFLCQGSPEQSIAGVQAQDLRLTLPLGDQAAMNQTTRSLQFQQWMEDLEHYYRDGEDPLLTLFALCDVLDSRNEYRSLLSREDYPFLSELESELASRYSESAYSNLLSNSLPKPEKTPLLFPYLFLLVALGLGYWFFKKRLAASKQIKNTFESLSTKEEALLGDIALGKSNKELADLHHISLSTVKTHLNNIYKKTGVQSRKELILKIKQEKTGISTPV